MDATRRATLEARGYAVVDDAADWLGLDEAERQVVDFRVRLAREVGRRREMDGLDEIGDMGSLDGLLRGRE